MKTLFRWSIGPILTLTLLLTANLTGNAQEPHYIQPHLRMDGTYVPGHMSDGSDGNIYLKRNTVKDVINPYTGRIGYKNLYSDYDPNRQYPYDIYSYSTFDYLR